MTYEEMVQTAKELVMGLPITASGPEVDEFVKEFKEDMAMAKANGWEIEIPFDIEDLTKIK